jgi:hypothetical protein
LIWYVAEFVAIWPDHLSYFNQIAGGPRGGPQWLDDSNVDWGQGLIQLREFLDEHPVEKVRLCHYGRIDPAYYGIHGEEFYIDKLLKPPEPGILILSAHCIAQAQSSLARAYDDGPQNWLAHATPSAIVGHAYYIYEVRQ